MLLFEQVKREELLQFAEGAITGLKINAEIQRFHGLSSFTTSFYCLHTFPPRWKVW